MRGSEIGVSQCLWLLLRLLFRNNLQNQILTLTMQVELQCERIGGFFSFSNHLGFEFFYYDAFQLWSVEALQHDKYHVKCS